MPAHDVFHAAVKQGLIKEGWTITDDPFLDYRQLLDANDRL